jgi:hypothetical protein
MTPVGARPSGMNEKVGHEKEHSQNNIREMNFHSS